MGSGKFERSILFVIDRGLDRERQRPRAESCGEGGPHWLPSIGLCAHGWSAEHALGICWPVAYTQQGVESNRRRQPWRLVTRP